MNINMLRKIDYYCGPAICSFLLFVRRFSSPIEPLHDPSKIKNLKNILVIKFFGMGTILLASPALRGLKKKSTSARITILTLSSNREICSILPSIDNVICLSIEKPLAFLRSFSKALADIKKTNYDVVIDLEFLTNFSAIVALMVTLFKKTKVIIGFSSVLRWRNNVHNINVSFDYSRHITKVFAKMVCSLTGENFQLSFEPEKATLLSNMDVSYMKRLAESHKDLARCNFFICVNINAGELSLHRRWPREYFMRIASELMKRPNVALFLIGTEADVEYVAEFKRSLSQHSRIIDLCGKTNIKELIGLFSESNLLITNDGGPLHLAGIVGLTTISFFGPETPYLYGPLEKRHHVFYEDLYCSPCLNIYNSKQTRCRNNTCITSIKSERVLKAIDEICNIQG